MTHEALAPTPEQLRKSVYEAPLRDQTTHRVAFRRRSPLDTLWDRGDINYPMHQAAHKLDYHHRGAQGVRVRYSDEVTSLNTDTEYPRTYHAQKIAQAEQYVLPCEWTALMCMIEESKTLEEIGRGLRSVSDRKILRQAGLSAVSSGLERLSFLWGFQERHKPPIA